MSPRSWLTHAVSGLTALGAVAAAPIAAHAAPLPAGTPFANNNPEVLVVQGNPTQLNLGIESGGHLTFTHVAGATYNYNGVGYNPGDGYLYGLARDTTGTSQSNPITSGDVLRIDAAGAVLDTGVASGIASGNVGAYDPSDGLEYLSAQGQSKLFRYNPATNAAAGTLTLSSALQVYDLAYAQGYLWGAYYDATNSVPKIERVTLTGANAGTVTDFTVAAGLLPGLSSSNNIVGAAWTYGNGNLGLSANTSGTVYQVSIATPGGSPPTFALVSQQSGPANSLNDGANVPGQTTNTSITSSAPTTATPGSTVTYTFNVTNNGPGNSSGFTLTDTLPGTLTNVTTSSSICSVSQNTFSCQGSPAASGTTTTVSVSATVPTPFTAAISTTATVVPNEAQTDSSSNATTATIQPAAPALTVTNTGPTGSQTPGGGGFSYTLQAGTSSSAGNETRPITVTDTLPSGIALSGAASGTNWSCTGAAGAATATCTYTPSSALAPGTALPQITVPVTVAPDARGTKTASAVVSSSDNANPAGASTGTAAVTLTPSVDDSVSVGGPASAVDGTASTFTVTAANAGPSTATNVSVTVPVPSGTTYAGGPAACSQSGGTVTCTQTSLAPNANQPFALRFTPTTPGTFRVGAAVTQTETDSSTGNNSATSGNVTVPRTADLSLSATGTGSAGPGGAVTDTFTVSNAGPDAASGFTVTDTLPSAVTNLSTTTSGCSISGQTLTCNEGTLASGQTTSVSVSFNAPATFTSSVADTATVTGSDSDPATGNNSASTTTRPLPVLSVTDDSVGAAAPGQTVTYTLTPGTSSAAGPESQPVTVTMTLPAGQTLNTTASGTNWTCTGAAGATTATCTYAPSSAIAPGTSLNAITVVAAIAPDSRGTPVASAVVSSADNAASPSASTATRRVSLTPSVEDSVTVTPPSSATVGQPATFTVRAANGGPSTATAVTVTVPVPSGATYTSGPAACAQSGGTVTCTQASLAPNASASFALVFTPTAPGPLSVGASVVQTETDSDRSDNSATSAPVTVPRATDLSLSASGPRAAAPGTTITDTFTVTDGGPAASNGFHFADTVPSGATAVSSPTAGCAVSGQTVSCVGAALASGATTTITVSFTAPSSFGSAIANSATVTANDSDSNHANDTATATTRPGTLLGLAAAVPATATPGTNASYTLIGRVGADGVGESQPVTITETLPSGVTVGATPTGAGWDCSATHVGSSHVSCTLTPSSAIAPGTALPVLTVPATLAPDARGTVVADASIDSSDNAASGAASRASASAALSPSVGDTVSVDPPASAAAGSAATFTVTAANGGPSTSTGTTVSIRVPAGAAYAGGPPECALSADGATVTCTVGTLAPGDRHPLALRFTPRSSGTLTVSAAIDQHEANAAPNGGASSASAPVGAAPGTAAGAPDLTITVTGPSPAPAVGDPGRYTIRVTNGGTAPDPGVVVTIPIPSGTTVESVSRGCTVSGSTIRCDAGTVGAGATSTFQVELVPSATGTITLTATAHGAGVDATPGNATASRSTRVAHGATRWLRVSLSTRPRARFGWRTRFVATVRNASSATASRVTVRVTLPARTVLRATVRGCRQRRRTLSCRIGTLRGHRRVRRVVLVRLRRRGAYRPAALARGTRYGIRASAGARTRVLVYVRPRLRLRVFFPGAQIPAGRDERIRFTIRTSNHTVAARVRVCDTVPAGARIVSAPGLTVRGTRACATVSRVGRSSREFGVIVRLPRDLRGRRVWDRAVASAPGLRAVTVARPVLVGG